MPRQILAPSDFLHLRSLDEVSQCDAVQEFIEALTQILPQLMGEAALPILTVLIASAARHVDFLVYRGDDLSNRDLIGRSTEPVTTPWTSHPLHQSLFTELCE